MWLKSYQPRITAAFIIVMLAMGYGLIMASLGGNELMPKCFFKTLTGMSCPGCGMGHSSIALFQGKITESFNHHPLGIPFHLFMLFVFPYILIDLFKNQKKVMDTLKKPWPNYLFFPLLGILLINWILKLLFL